MIFLSKLPQRCVIFTQLFKYQMEENIADIVRADMPLEENCPRDGPPIVIITQVGSSDGASPRAPG